MSHLFQESPPFIPGRPDLRVVRQVAYQSGSSRDLWSKLPNIDFRVRGLEGIRLTDALNVHSDELDQRDDLMFATSDVGTAISCRILVCALYNSDFNCHSVLAVSSKGFSRTINRCV